MNKSSLFSHDLTTKVTNTDPILGISKSLTGVYFQDLRGSADGRALTTMRPAFYLELTNVG